jgi:hypothetical protein
LQGFPDAQGLQGLHADAAHGFDAAHGLQGFALASASRGTVHSVAPPAAPAAHGLHGFADAHGLQGFAAAQGLHGFAAAHGLQGFAAAQGLHGFAAAHGLHGFEAAHGLQVAAAGVVVVVTVATPPTAKPAITTMGIMDVESSARFRAGSIIDLPGGFTHPVPPRGIPPHRGRERTPGGHGREVNAVHGCVTARAIVWFSVTRRGLTHAGCAGNRRTPGHRGFLERFKT